MGEAQRRGVNIGAMHRLKSSLPAEHPSSPAIGAEESAGESLRVALPQARSLALDLLKCVLALAVVAIHSSPLAAVSAGLNSVLINGLCRIAVPTFFVINGFYIAGALRDEASFARYMRRMGSLYLFWMLVYAPFYIAPHGNSLLAILKTVVFGYLHLWYVAALLIAAPALFVVHDKISSRSLAAVAGTLFGLGVAMQYGSYYSGGVQHYTLYRNAVFFGFPFLSIGYLVRVGFFAGLSELWRRQLLVAGMLFLATEIAIAQTRDRIGSAFDMYASLILVCPLLLDKARQIGRKISRDDFSVVSSVIYFAHPWGIKITQRLVHQDVGAEVFLGSLLFCLAIAYPLKRLSLRWPFIL